MVEASKYQEEKTEITRRRITLGIVVAALAAGFGSAFSALKLMAPKKKKAGNGSTVSAGDQLVYADGKKKGSPVQASSLKVGDSVTVCPKGKGKNDLNTVQLIRLKESDFKPPTRMKLTDQGFVAYSAICTHQGCTVSWVKDKKAPDASYIECFCHNSIFNPARGGKVMGGPAPIPLAQIGVKVATDGTLVFTSGFDGRIGPQV